MAHGPSDDSHLRKGLRQRHLTMIAIGGVIGAGLFVGSGAVIKEVGPAAFLTYAITGVMMLLLMTATNLYSVTSYGEFEYWFAGVKVATIVVFIALGLLYVFGLWPGHRMDFSNLTNNGGFFPNGVGALFSGIVIVIFSMVGAEIA